MKIGTTATNLRFNSSFSAIDPSVNTWSFHRPRIHFILPPVRFFTCSVVDESETGPRLPAAIMSEVVGVTMSRESCVGFTSVSRRMRERSVHCPGVRERAPTRGVQDPRPTRVGVPHRRDDAPAGPFTDRVPARQFLPHRPVFRPFCALEAGGQGPNALSGSLMALPHSFSRAQCVLSDDVIWLLKGMRGILARLHGESSSPLQAREPVALTERALRSKTVRTKPTARSLAGSRDHSA